MVCGRNERVLRSFLGLASQSIYPTGPNGEDLEDWPSVLVPPGLTLKMLSTVPVAFGSMGPSTVQQSLDVLVYIEVGKTHFFSDQRFSRHLRMRKKV